MNTNERVLELLIQTALNWTVTKDALYTNAGESSGGYGMFRSDNRQCLGIVGERYTPFQNYQMVETIMQACENLNIPINHGGMLNGGARYTYKLRCQTSTLASLMLRGKSLALTATTGQRPLASEPPILWLFAKTPSIAPLVRLPRFVTRLITKSAFLPLPKAFA